MQIKINKSYKQAKQIITIRPVPVNTYEEALIAITLSLKETDSLVLTINR